MAQYLEQFNYTLTSSSLPYAINNGAPYFDSGFCFLPTDSFINKDFAGSAYSFQGQNYVGNYAISFDLVLDFITEATFTILCYGSLSAAPALYVNQQSSPYMQLCWTNYGIVNSNTNAGAISLGDFNGTTVNETGTYRITYLKRIVNSNTRQVAMHVVSPTGVHYKSGWAVAYDDYNHNQIGNNTTGVGGEIAIGTISVQDELDTNQLDSILASGEGALSTVATPSISVAGGTYDNVVNATASCYTPDAVIYYTIDGSDPTTASSVFSGSVAFGPSYTPLNVKLFASNGVLTDSQIVSVTYTFVCATPTATPPTGIYSSTVQVELASTTVGSSVFYTLDGSNPTIASTLYVTPIEVPAGTRAQIRCIAAAVDFQDSSVFESMYNHQVTRVDNWENLDNWEVNQPTWLSLPGNNTLVVLSDNPVLKLIEPVVDIFVVEVSLVPNDDALIYFINADSTATQFDQLGSADIQFGVIFEQEFGGYSLDIVLIWNNGTQQQLAIADYIAGQTYRLMFGKIGSSLLLKVYNEANELIADVTETLLVSSDEVKLLVGAGRTATVWNPMTFRYGLSELEAEDIIDSGEITEHVADPSISPSSGTYTDDIFVTLTCETTEATIRYTTDGSEPTLSSTPYSGPFSVGPQALPVGTVTTETVLGVSTPVVVMDDGNQWTAANFTYTTESIGRFWNDAASDDGYGGYYNRADGSAIALSGVLEDGWRIPDHNIDVIPLKTALDLRYSNSGGIGLLDPSGFNAVYAGFVDPSGVWSGRGSFGFFLALGDDVAGLAAVYYYGVMSGSNEFTAQYLTEQMIGLAGVDYLSISLRLVRAAPLGTTATVRARAFHAVLPPSNIVEANYTFADALQVALPTIEPVSGLYEASSMLVSIACETVGAIIRYTLDGSTPSEVSNLYTGTLELTAPFNNVVSAIAYLAGYEASSVAQQTYEVVLPVVPPVFTPPSGTYADTVSVSMSADDGASIWYHIEGTPETDWFVYSTPLTITETTTIAARAEIGSRASLYAYATYSISLYQKKNSVLLYDFAFGIST